MAKGRVIGVNNPPSKAQILFAELCDSGVDVSTMIRKTCEDLEIYSEEQLYEYRINIIQTHLDMSNLLGKYDAVAAYGLLIDIFCCECEEIDCDDNPSSDPNEPASSYGCVYFFESRIAKMGWFVTNINRNQEEGELEYINLNANRCIHEQQDFEYPKFIPGSFEGSCLECLEQLESE